MTNKINKNGWNNKVVHLNRMKFPPLSENINSTSNHRNTKNEIKQRIKPRPVE